MQQINPSTIQNDLIHSANAIGSLSPFPSKSNFCFLPGISFPPPNPTPVFCLNTFKSCSVSSAHSRTRCLPSKCVCRSVLYAFSASCRDTNSRNANPRVRASNFFGSLTDFRWPWALLQGEMSKLIYMLISRWIRYMPKEITNVFLRSFERHIFYNKFCSPALGIHTILILGWCIFFGATTCELDV